ncbi:hypothetical protein COB55_02960 [Candidatus Wolfebacteria bacterium]|nr:MAG: hypothetical protein COB55_02960 [Candidatus Wolfebacteria bacterium]
MIYSDTCQTLKLGNKILFFEVVIIARPSSIAMGTTLRRSFHELLAGKEKSLLRKAIVLNPAYKSLSNTFIVKQKPS